MVVQVDEASVTASVTMEGVGAGGIVTPPYAAVAVPEGAVEDAAADELRLAPIWSAAFLKLVKELGEPSAPQFTANTIPAPQWLAGVFAACAQYTQIG